MRIAQDNSAITNLIAFQNRYTGPGAVSVTPDDYASAEEIHEKLVHRKLEKWEPATKAALSGVCRRFTSWCEADTHTSNDYRIFAYPATRVAAFLESERQRHIRQGTSPAINVANAFTEMVRLSAIQGCPDFNSAEMAHMQVVGGIAMLDSVQQKLTADPDFKRRGNQAVLTCDDIENYLTVCSQQGIRLAAMRAKVILLIGCATGFRACGMIHMTCYNLIKDAPDQYNTSRPQQLDILGVGLTKHKTNKTGKPVFTGLTRHAQADKDAFAALGELLVFEMHCGR